MSEHVSGWLEPLKGDASCFDIVDVYDHRTSNERTLKLVLEIDKVKDNFVQLLNLAVKSIKNGANGG